jgi:FixJ family two-component response regulator
MAAAKTVVVVEDDDLMLRAMQRLLLAHGFAARCYSSAEAFLDLGVHSNAICMLLDIRLGGMSGVELQRSLRTSGSTLPVVFVTAFDSESVRREALEAGCAAYLTKPFSASALIEAIVTAANLPHADHGRRDARD